MVLSVTNTSTTLTNWATISKCFLFMLMLCYARRNSYGMTRTWFDIQYNFSIYFVYGPGPGTTFFQHTQKIFSYWLINSRNTIKIGNKNKWTTSKKYRKKNLEYSGIWTSNPQLHTVHLHSPSSLPTELFGTWGRWFKFNTWTDKSVLKWNEFSKLIPVVTPLLTKAIMFASRT